MFSAIRRTSEYVGPVRPDKEAGEPVAYMAAPLRGPKGDFAGVIAAEVSLKSVWAGVDALNARSGGHAYLVDRSGLLLAYGGDTARALRGENLSFLPEVRAFADGVWRPHPWLPVRGIDGSLVVATHAPLGLPDWSLIIEKPLFNAYLPVLKMAGLMLAVMLLSLLLAVLISLRLARAITGPVLDLRAAALEVAGGKLDQRVEIHSSDEIGDLAAAFNKMTAALHKSTTSIANLNAEVELRSAVQKELQRNQDRFQAIADSTGDWLWEFDAEGRYTYCSPVVESVLGYKPGEVLGRHFWDFFIPQEREALKKFALEGFAGKQPYKNFVLRNLHKDGHEVMVESSGVPILAADGSLLGYRGADRDITLRYRAQEGLRESEQRFRDIVDNTGEWIWETDTDGVCIYTNAVCRAVLGYEPEELLGTSVGDYFFPEDRPEYERILASLKAAPKPYQGVLRNRRKDGSEVIIEVHGVPVFTPDGKLLGFRGVDRDITQRHRAEEALKASEQRFRDIAENTGECVWEIDTAGMCTYVNPLSLEIMGYQPSEVLGRSILDFMSPVHRPEVEALLAALMAAPKPVRALTVNARHRDGREIMLECNAVPMRGPDGKLLGYRGVHRDITQRHRAEQALRESEQRFRDIAENTGECIWEMDARGVCSYINSLSLEMFGYSPSEIIGRNTLEFFSPGGKEAAAGILAQLVSDPRPRHGLALLARHRDGRELMLESNVVPMTGPGGTLLGFRGVHRDITERHRAEQALAEEKERLYVTLHSIGDAVIAVDAQGRVQLMNKVAEGLTGWSEAYASGRPLPEVFRIINGRTGAPCENPVEKVMKTGAIVGLANHTVLVSRNGARYSIADSGAPIFCRDGSICGVILVFRDITAEHAMQDQIRLRTTAMEASVNGIVITDMQLRLVYANRSLRVMLGAGTQAQLKDLSPSAVAMDARLMENSLAAVKRDGSWSGEADIRRLDGSTLKAQVTATLVRDEEGLPAYMMCIVADVTELRRKDEQLREMEMEKRVNEAASRAKSAFLANMSHELRTPLTAVLASSSMLLEGMFGKLTHKQREYVKNITAAGRHLLGLINDILDLSKVESGKMELELSPVSVQTLLHDCLMLMRSHAIRANVHLEEKLDFPEGLEVEADSRKWKQMLINLLSNAVKFTPTGGKVSLLAELLPSHALPPQAVEEARKNSGGAHEFLHLCVQDTGIGIKEKDMDKLFLPFSQIDSRNDRNFGGTGLGLALVKKLAELHGGCVMARSQYGHGSTFCLFLPVRRLPPKPRQPRHAPPHPRGRH
ncbi:MAG: PAS domain S-box protein [Elusimicrobia bacterium]|nr:PAS domain S-box protein [Elusimicrobiota bacterium]